LTKVPWGAVVAIEPKSGRVLALTGYSADRQSGNDFALRGGMPAASLFKVVTAAAAVEEAGLEPSSLIHFRGGNYTLGMSNYLPDVKKDRRLITLEQALATSCNPAFGRIGSKYLSASILSRYASSFGFNQDLPFDLPLSISSFTPPQNEYELARTSAGFGPALISPLHAAMMAAAIGNSGVMMRPRLVDKIISVNGDVAYQSTPAVYQRSVAANSARIVLDMMEATTLKGTARKHFSKAKSLKNIQVAAKTGTLSGQSPKGVFHWLVAVAPSDDPEIALATLVVDPGNAPINGTALGRLFLEKYFANQN
jgi:penicillin-binding protein A